MRGANKVIKDGNSYLTVRDHSDHRKRLTINHQTFTKQGLLTLAKSLVALSESLFDSDTEDDGYDEAVF